MARDVSFEIGDTLLQRGGVIKDDVVKGRLYGPKSAPLIVVMGGISADRFVADDPIRQKGWWSPLVRKGGAIDINRFQVLGYDFAPANERDDLPNVITTEDQAMRLKKLLDGLGINAAALIGSSYGGMVALAFAKDYPDQVANLCIIGAAHRPYPIGVAWRGIQRRMVRVAMKAGVPKEGLKLARELAMTTYRTPVEFDDRFDLEETSSDPSRFDICDYLGSRGDDFAERMDAERFLLLSESIDLHRVSPEEISTPALLMSAISDQLAPLPDMRELRDRLAGPSELFTFTSLFGHDAFLKEFDMMAPKLEEFCGGLK
ncbi:MAG: homoserine O-succinyltransferase [Hellea sp.]|nr:homoserine O-succinyltransferase [Hellea sp.]